MIAGPLISPVLIPMLPKVVIPLTYKFVASRYPISYLSVPVPTIPVASLLTNSFHPTCAKYNLPVL